MLLAPLLVTTLTLAPTGAASRIDLGVGADVALDSWRYPPPPGWFEVPGGHSTGGEAFAGMTLYLRDVVDDDAPPTLQPFLQRTSFFHLGGGGGGYSATNPSGNVPTFGSHFGDVGLSAGGYAGRWFYGYASLGVSYSEASENGVKTSSSLSVPVDVAVGVRAGSLLLAAGWTLRPIAVDDSPFRVDFWGGVYVRAYGVVRKKLSLGALVQVLDGGAFVAGDATLYLARRFGIGTYLHGSRSTPGSLGRDNVGTGVSFEAWINSRFALWLAYHFDWNHYAPSGRSDEEHDYVSVISLQALIRPR
jgi:hypothetical protein